MENEEILKQLAESNARLASVLEKMGSDQTHEKTPTVADTMTATALHGTTGIFRGPGLERDIITAHVRPRGIDQLLPLLPSVNEDPRFASLTGYGAPAGDQPSDACHDAPTGYVKGCNLTARFGLKRFDTQTIEMDKVMLRVNRGDFTDLVLRGQVLGLTGLSPKGLNQADILNVVTMSEMVIVGVNFERALNVDIWQGTLAGGSFPGLDSQIVTGQVDADTNTTCPSLDSDVKNFAWNDVCGHDRDIVEYMSMMEYYLNWNAESMGLDPVEWVVVMRPQLWWELSACWPCRYLTNRCENASGTSIGIINDNVNINMRDDMRKRSTIPINGREYRVVLDTGINEYNATTAPLRDGQFASSIYFLPLTITGNFPVTYREYLDYRQAQPDVNLLRGKEPFWTDDGVYSWVFVDHNFWCYKLGAKTEQRVILRTPQLAGKIQRVAYSPLQHLREPDPDSPYFVNGGVSSRAAGTAYSVWGLPR